MPSKQLDDIVKSLQDYIQTYDEKIDDVNASCAYEVFKKNEKSWKSIVPFFHTADPESLYWKALLICSDALIISKKSSTKSVGKLQADINWFESTIKYKLEEKCYLFLQLGICWHTLDDVYDKYAIECFKKYIFYLLSASYVSSYENLNCYAFHSCSKHVIESLINEEINLTPSNQFNDVFDCPIISLLDNNDEISKLIKNAYDSCLTVACFMRNNKLPIYTSSESWKEPKRRGDKKEFRNELMWAHYADSHKGICIQYTFPSSLKTTAADSNRNVTCIDDVNYSNINKLINKNAISVKQSFFQKGKSWKYENELRLINFNLDGTGTYEYIPIKNCISAVYFGVNCTKKDQDTIVNILRDRTFKIIHKRLESAGGDWIEEKKIVFYKMEKDSNRFGEIKEKKLKI